MADIINVSVCRIRRSTAGAAFYVPATYSISKYTRESQIADNNAAVLMKLLRNVLQSQDDVTTTLSSHNHITYSRRRGGIAEKFKERLCNRLLLKLLHERGDTSREVQT